MKEKVNRTQIQSPDSTADPTGPYGLAKELNEAQKGQDQFALKVEEGDRVLRSRGGEVLQKAHSQAPHLRNDNTGQRTSTP